MSYLEDNPRVKLWHIEGLIEFYEAQAKLVGFPLAAGTAKDCLRRYTKIRDQLLEEIKDNDVINSWC